jgi:hypothetical protein
VITSPDGVQWRTVYNPPRPNRYGLVEASDGGQLMVVVPAADGWRSVLLNAASATSGRLPTRLDPASVWIKPKLAHGPAGWALFVTTSRPWERTDATRGWAVDAGEWIVSQLPDSTDVTARSVDGTTSFRYAGESPDVVRSGGDVTLLRPGTAEELVRITGMQIAQSRGGVTADEAEIKAQVFFSEDGSSWRVIWESANDTWDGTIAVGGTEIVLSGSRLTGPPITIPITE